LSRDTAIQAQKQLSKRAQEDFIATARLEGAILTGILTLIHAILTRIPNWLEVDLRKKRGELSTESELKVR
jgi:hypothetical protein